MHREARTRRERRLMFIAVMQLLPIVIVVSAMLLSGCKSGLPPTLPADVTVQVMCDPVICEIEGIAYVDTNGNGTIDASDSPLEGVTFFWAEEDMGTTDTSGSMVSHRHGNSGECTFGQSHLVYVEPPESSMYRVIGSAQTTARCEYNKVTVQFLFAPRVITWRSQRLTEPERAVIKKIITDYEAEHLGVDIVIEWQDDWEELSYRKYIGADIVGLDDALLSDEFVYEGGLLDLTDVLPWENLVLDWKPSDSEVEEGRYVFNIGFTVDMLLYNPEIFDELNIEVPEDHQFTQDGFLEVVKKCYETGHPSNIAHYYAPYSAGYVTRQLLCALAGPGAFDMYWSGNQSWDTPIVRMELAYLTELLDAGMWSGLEQGYDLPDFFHSKSGDCLFFVDSRYASMALKPTEESVQDSDWHFGILRYPLMDNATAPNTLLARVEPGYGVVSDSEHSEIALDILAFAMQPKYGALWEAVTHQPSTIRYDSETDWPSDELLGEIGVESKELDWYWEQFDRVYGALLTAYVPPRACQGFAHARDTILNEYPPWAWVDADKTIAELDATLCDQ